MGGQGGETKREENDKRGELRHAVKLSDKKDTSNVMCWTKKR